MVWHRQANSAWTPGCIIQPPCRRKVPEELESRGNLTESQNHRGDELDLSRPSARLTTLPLGRGGEGRRGYTRVIGTAAPRTAEQEGTEGEGKEAYRSAGGVGGGKAAWQVVYSLARRAKESRHHPGQTTHLLFSLPDRQQYCSLLLFTFLPGQKAENRRQTTASLSKGRDHLGKACVNLAFVTHGIGEVRERNAASRGLGTRALSPRPT